MKSPNTVVEYNAKTVRCHGAERAARPYTCHRWSTECVYATARHNKSTPPRTRPVPDAGSHSQQTTMPSAVIELQLRMRYTRLQAGERSQCGEWNTGNGNLRGEQ